jgi:hypothetical protein
MYYTNHLFFPHIQNMKKTNKCVCYWVLLALTLTTPGLLTLALALALPSLLATPGLLALTLALTLALAGATHRGHHIRH